eukprot:5709822-Prymnesium_polylepis.1
MPTLPILCKRRRLKSLVTIQSGLISSCAGKAVADTTETSAATRVTATRVAAIEKTRRRHQLDLALKSRRRQSHGCISQYRCAGAGGLATPLCRRARQTRISTRGHLSQGAGRVPGRHLAPN